MIYLDNAATSFPKPKAVAQEMCRSVECYAANAGRGGHTLSLQSAGKIYEVRKKAADFFNLSDPSRVIFCQNATAALNTVIKGVFSRREKVLISNFEHNSVLRPVASTCTYDVFEVADTQRTLQNIEEKITPFTRGIICTAVSNVTGKELPIREICALAKARGLITVIDGSQGAGSMPLGTDIGYDFMCTAGHKGLFGPQGTGLIIVNCDIPVKPVMEGGSGSHSLLLTQPDELPERLEAGTLNLHGIAGLGAGLDFVSENTGRIAEHQKRLVFYLADNLRDMGARVFDTDGHLLSFNLGEKDSESVAAYLDNCGICVRAGLHCAPLAHKSLGTLSQGTVRISPSVFNTVNHADRFLECINMLKNC